MANEPAISAYGQRNAQAPAQLALFSFLVGKWSGVGKALLPDGGHAEFELTWIGRYIVNGMAISDEIHSLAPDGSPFWGSASATSTRTRARGSSNTSMSRTRSFVGR